MQGKTLKNGKICDNLFNAQKVKLTLRILI